MPNPYFTSLSYLNTDYRRSTGNINDITVAGGTAPLTVTWTGPHGFSSGPHVDTVHSLNNLPQGEYVGTVEDSEGLTSTINIPIQNKGRLYLSVNKTQTTTDCEGELSISEFMHNGFNFTYDLMDGDGNVLSTYNGTPGNEIHQFTNLCNGGYIIRAVETQQTQYNFDGSNTTTTVVPDNNTFAYSTYLVTQDIVNGTCGSDSLFISDSIFNATGSTIKSYIQVLTKNNLPIDPSSIKIKDEIVRAPKPKNGVTKEECSEASYKISISKNKTEVDRECDYTSFSLDGNGLVLFTHSNGDKDYNISSECCESISFTPELDGNNKYVCRWKAEETEPCSKFKITNKVNNDGYYVFINGDTGELTDELPSAECCTNENLVHVEDNGIFHCKPKEVVSEPSCNDYVFTGEFEDTNEPENRYAIFQYEGGTTNSVLSAECCDINGLIATTVNGGVRCIEEYEDCNTYRVDSISSKGYVVFKNNDDILVNHVNDAECCTEHGFEAELTEDGRILCHEPKPQEQLPKLELIKVIPEGDCSKMTMKVHGKPNSVVKYRILVREVGDHGYFNSLSYVGGEDITPDYPSPSEGSYCEGTLKVGSSGVADLIMETCARPPLRNASNNCTELEFAIYDYDNKTINNNNKRFSRACFNN
jgi:hypothetical protein